MTVETKEIINYLRINNGRNLSNSKAEFFRNVAFDLLQKFETRTYSEVEQFCEFLLESAKSAQIKILGVESTAERIKDEDFYRNALNN
ncbi:hypothetical protein [Flavobacterium turcicum]|uniref:DNA-binding protein n=1 Tax=Flavobacterium turcicum TaxID=2764718 RepID=A0ABR7JJL0_9FLAO|nr:hypothetical protein [Flavobacterium turcicum]MBC5864677.1 hypothetical protein [Flavobacterium turcicum]NHL03409.1 hypothetical protein [Flavobacterium turcicum]